MPDVPSVQTMLGEAGASPGVELDGKTWTIAHPVQKAKALLEEHIAADAVNEVAALEKVVPAATYAKLFAGVLTLVGGKHYRTGGDGWKAALAGPDGNALFVLSLLRVHHPAAALADARALLTKRPLQTVAALARVCPDFFAEIVRELTIPDEAKAAAVADLTAKLLGAIRATESAAPQ